MQCAALFIGKNHPTQTSTHAHILHFNKVVIFQVNLG